MSASIARYIKRDAWEMLLLAVATAALGACFLQGFKVGDALLAGPFALLALVLIVVALFAVTASKRTMLPGGIALGVVALGALLAGLALSEGPLTQDSAGNWFLGVLLVELAGAVPFALSRSCAGTAVLLICGIFTCSWTQFFFEAPVTVPALAFLFSGIALLVYKNYLCSVRAAMSARQVSFPLGFVTALGTALAALVIGVAVWFGVIAPLNPGVVDVELITEYRALEEVAARGISQERMVSNIDLTGSETTSGSRTTDDLRVEEDGIPMPARPLETPPEEEQPTGSFMGIDLEELTDSFDVQANPALRVLLWLLALLLPLAVVAYFVGRRWWRTRRLRKIRELPPEQQVQALYLFLAKRLGRIGFAVPKGQTLLEFARNNAGAMEVLDTAAGASFSQATQAYVRVAYGEQAPTEAELACLVAYYQGFWRAARRQLGNVRYFVKSFRL